MRNVKQPEERKKEIVETALELFIERGFETTTVSDIVKRIGVAQGTFYYHFKSKEEVIESIIDNFIDAIIIEITVIVYSNISPVEKIMKSLNIFSSFSCENEEDRLISKLHSIKNIDIHQRYFLKLTMKVSGLLVIIIEEGKKAGLFKVEHTLEVVELLTVGYSFLFDNGIKEWTFDEYKRRILAMPEIFEKLLGCEKGLLNAVSDVYLKNMENFFADCSNKLIKGFEGIITNITNVVQKKEEKI